MFEFDFQPEIEATNVDRIPAEYKPFYVEKDGAFRMDDRLAKKLDTGNLKKAIESERRQREAMEKQINQWKSTGKTPEEITSLIEASKKSDEERAQKEEQDAARAGQWESLRKQMNDKHQNDLKAKDEVINKRTSMFHQWMVNALAGQAISAAKGEPELLLPIVSKNVKVAEENEQFHVRVVDDEGNVRVNGKGEPLTISDLVSEMRGSEKLGRAFEASDRRGSGMPPVNGKGSGGPGPDADLNKLLPMQRLAEARKRGLTTQRN